MIIKGLKDCSKYFTSIGFSMTPPTLKKYIKVGLPCWFEFGTYHFHTDVIDDYFKARCREQVPALPEEISGK